MSGNDEQLSRVLTLLNEQGRGQFVTITPESLNGSALVDLDDDTKSELEFRLTAYF